jgi:hypothetical protein
VLGAGELLERSADAVLSGRLSFARCARLLRILRLDRLLARPFGRCFAQARQFVFVEAAFVFFLDLAGALEILFLDEDVPSAGPPIARLPLLGARRGNLRDSLQVQCHGAR